MLAAGTVVMLMILVGTVVVVTRLQHRPQPEAAMVTVRVDGDRLSMTSPFGASTITLEATLRNSATNGSFNLLRTLLGGTVVHRTADDVAPVRTSLGTLGGNHGFPEVAVFPNPDGKSDADLGSVWTDGDRRYVLLSVDRSGGLVVGGDYSDLGGVISSARVAPGRELRAVAGAVHAAPVPGPGEPTQLRPATARVAVGLTCDGTPVGGNGDGTAESAGSSGSSTASPPQDCRQVEVDERYEVLDYADLYDQVQAHVGIPYTQLDVRGAFRVENRYRFSAGGLTTVHSELVALEPVQLAATGLLQSAPLERTPERTVIRQLPGVRPIDGMDFARGVDLGSYATNVHVTSADLLEPGRPPTFSFDRIIEHGRTTIGFALGYVPTGDQAGSQAARTAAASADLWDLRATGKSYPVALTSRRLATGERVVVDGFRAYLDPAEADVVAAKVADGTIDGCPVPDVC